MSLLKVKLNRFLNSISCHLGWHSWQVKESVHSDTTVMMCVHCPIRVVAPVVKGELGVIQTLVDFQDGYHALKIFEDGNCILIIKFTRKEIIQQGREMLACANKTASIFHDSKNGPYIKPKKSDAGSNKAT